MSTPIYIGALRQPNIARAMEAIAPIVEAADLQLIGLERSQEGRRTILWVFLDHSDGITLDQCGEISPEISAVLDVEDAVVTMLNERKELLNNVFKQCGDKEFTFIERSGAYLGFLFGVLQTILWYFYKGMWVLPAAGFIVGGAC